MPGFWSHKLVSHYLPASERDGVALLTDKGSGSVALLTGKFSGSDVAVASRQEVVVLASRQGVVAVASRQEMVLA